MNKKGFTLIELLAVIVILAIIAFIAVPIILNVIENSRKGAKESSTLGYIDAVEKKYMMAQVNASANKLRPGTYTVAQLSTLGVNIKGDKPDDSSVIVINNKGQVTTAWITFGKDYKIYYDGKSAIADKSDYKDKSGITHNDQPEGAFVCNVLIETCDLDTVGSLVKINEEEFYVVGQEDATHVKLLAKWNLNVGKNLQPGTKGIQNSKAVGYNGNESLKVDNAYPATVPFSNTNYWDGAPSYPSYVYTNEKVNSVYKASIAQYVDNYVSYLNDQGANVTGRLISYEELVSLGCSDAIGYCDTSHGATAPAWVNSTSYWIGSAASYDYARVVHFFGDFSSNYYTNDYDNGVRPLIILEK